ncbi:hypothetical protein Tco_1050786, partial [Tanacetum coccineum]
MRVRRETTKASYKENVEADHRLLLRTEWTMFRSLCFQNWNDLPRDIPLDRIEVLRYDIKGVKNIRVIPYSIHSDDGNPTSVNIKQALRQ